MKFKRMFLLLPVIAVTSCGYSLSYLVEGNKYNSPIFTENYYQVWDANLKNATEKSFKDDLPFITSFKDIYQIDQATTAKNITEYGEKYKMNNVDSMFNYGVQSKLFDGIIECDGVGYQLLRVQADSEGFSVRFSKESSELSYLALQFKSTTNNQRPCLVKPETGEPYLHDDSDMFHESTITLYTSIYCKNDKNEIEKYTYKSVIVNANTNNGHSYIFYGLNLREEHLTRVIGYSVNYEFNDETIISWTKEHGGPDIEYAMFIYELFLPYTTWH